MPALRGAPVYGIGKGRQKNGDPNFPIFLAKLRLPIMRIIGTCPCLTPSRRPAPFAACRRQKAWVYITSLCKLPLFYEPLRLAHNSTPQFRRPPILGGSSAKRRLHPRYCYVGFFAGKEKGRFIFSRRYASLCRVLRTRLEFRRKISAAAYL